MNDYLTVDQLATRLQLGRASVNYHIRLGHIRAEKHGRDWAIPQAEADRVEGVYRRHGTWRKPAEVAGD